MEKVSYSISKNNCLDRVFRIRVVITWFYTMAESVHANKIQIPYINLKNNDKD